MKRSEAKCSLIGIMKILAKEEEQIHSLMKAETRE